MSRSLATIRIEVVVVQQGATQVAKDFKDTLGPAIDDVDRKGGRLGNTFRDLAGAFTALVVARGAANILGGLLRPAVDLDTALAQLRGQVAGTGGDFEALKNAALKAAAETKFSPTEAIEGMAIFLAGTNDAEAALHAIGPAARLAMGSMGKLGLADAVKLSATLFREFRFEGQELQRAMSDVFFVTKQFGVPLEQLRIGLPRLAQAAAFGSGSFRDLSIAFGLAAAKGGSAREAAAQVRRAFVELADPDRKRALQELFALPLEGRANLDLLRDVIAPIVDQVIAAPDKFLAVRNALVATFGGDAQKAIITAFDRLFHGMKDLDGQTRRGSDALAMLNRKFEEQRALADFVREAMKPLSAQFERLSELGGQILARAGGPVIGMLATVARAVVAVLEQLNILMQSPVIGFFIAMQTAGVAFGLAVGALAFGLFGLSKLLTVTVANLGAWVATSGGFFRAFAASGRAMAAALRGQVVPAAGAAAATIGAAGAVAAASGAAAAAGATGWRAFGLAIKIAAGPLMLLANLGLVVWSIYEAIKASNVGATADAGISKLDLANKGLAGNVVALGETVDEMGEKLEESLDPIADVLAQLDKALSRPFEKVDLNIINAAVRAIEGRAGRPGGLPVETARVYAAQGRFVVGALTEAVRSGAGLTRDAFARVLEQATNFVSGLDALGALPEKAVGKLNEQVNNLSGALGETAKARETAFFAAQAEVARSRRGAPLLFSTTISGAPFTRTLPGPGRLEASESLQAFRGAAPDRSLAIDLARDTTSQVAAALSKVRLNAVLEVNEQALAVAVKSLDVDRAREGAATDRAMSGYQPGRFQ